MLMIDEIVEDLKKQGIPVGVHCDTSKLDYTDRGYRLYKKRRYRRRTEVGSRNIQKDYKNN